MRSRPILAALIAALSLTLSAGLASAGPRVALAIGVSAYEGSPLPSPVKDASEVAKALSDFGFEVTLAKDVNSAQFKQAVDAFIAKARGAEAAVVYFSGHGMQVNGEVYMMASDTRIDRPDLYQRDDLTVNGIVDRLQAAGVDFKFVIVDACRNNPFADGNTRNALAVANAGRAERRTPATNALVSFASASGQYSQDWGGTLGLSLYTAALIDVMKRNQRIEVRDLTQQARALVLQQVAARGANAQNPWEGSSLARPVHLERTRGGLVVAFEAGGARGAEGRPGGRLIDRVAVMLIAAGPSERVAEAGAARPVATQGRGAASQRGRYGVATAK